MRGALGTWIRGVLTAWGWYVAGAITVLLGLWLYARRLGFELEIPSRDEQE